MARLDAAQRMSLLAVGVAVDFRPEAVLMRQGEPGTCLFVLLRGLVKASVTTEAGNETILEIRGRGDVVGEFAILDDKDRSATVGALTEVSAVRVEKAAYFALSRDNPLIAHKMAQTLVAKIRSVIDVHASVRGQQARHRIANLLCGLAERLSQPPDPDGIALPLTQSDLAALAGVAESTVERVLRELREQGIVSTRYRQIVVRQLIALRTRASEAGDAPPFG